MANNEIEYVILNVRKDLTKETRDYMKRLCNSRTPKITYGQLLEEAFGNKNINV